MSKRRVVITGLGMVSPVGGTVQESWDAILQGRSGVRLISAFDTSDLTTRISASVQNFDAAAYMTPKEARRLDVFIHYAIAAAAQAIADANLESNDEIANRIGVAIGSGIGGLPFIEKCHNTLKDSGPRKVSPFFIPGCIINMAAGVVSIKFNLKGPNIAIVTACTTGTHNIGHAARMIAYGDADAMVTGGTEMATTKLGVCGFGAAKALSRRNDEPERASRPWDRERDGFVLGDGAGVLVLEEYEFAKKRGARIYAELTGFGMSADAFHMTASDVEGEGALVSMRNTLHDAGVNPDDIDYINAHGTSTPVGDPAEAMAIHKAFGDHAKKVAISSTKSMTGHLLGAAGAIEAIFTVLAIRDQVAPPTINLDNPDEGCDLDFVPHKAREMPINMALSNSFGFGGTNGSLVFRKLSNSKH